MRKAYCLTGVLVFLVSFSLFAADDAPQEPASFPLHEASAFGDSMNIMLARGQMDQCSKERDPDVAVYPKFTSDSPLFGKVGFDGEWWDDNSGTIYHFALDESAGTGKGYDRLYFDFNRNRDLTDEPPFAEMEKSPSGADPGWQEIDQLVCFDYIEVPFDFGSELGIRPFRILPRLSISTKYGYYAALGFVCPVIRQGTAVIGGEEFPVTMAQAYRITGRFDNPATYLAAGPGEPHWMQFLTAFRYANDKLYSLSTTPIGDTLFVREYDGDFGVFKVGAGGREEATDITFSGNFRSQDSVVAVGAIDKGDFPFPSSAEEALVPVGDYYVDTLSIKFGRFSIFLSVNYHSDGLPRQRRGNPFKRAITIRKGKPFVLDFSNTPEVLFASPKELEHFKPGDSVEVKAVLIDPVLDIMIRNINDTSRKTMKTYKSPDGGEDSFETPVSLDPKVVVKDSAGKTFAEGTLPFG